MNHSIRSICVFCGSAENINQEYIVAAEWMGNLLARAGIRMVYGAGKTGLMGAVADGMLRAGGEVIGIVPHNLNTPRLIHSNLTQLEIVSDIHTRKARMSELAEGFIALPGGFGTLDELFETLTWAQIGLHQKPIGLLNTRNYYRPLMSMVEHARQEGFIYNEHKLLLVIENDPPTLLSSILSFNYPDNLERWVKRE